MAMDSILVPSLEYFFPGSCYKTVVEDHEFGNGKKLVRLIVAILFHFLFAAQCLKLMNSRFLSLTVLLGALIG